MWDLSDPINDYLKTVNYFPVILRLQKEKPEMITGNDCMLSIRDEREEII